MPSEKPVGLAFRNLSNIRPVGSEVFPINDFFTIPGVVGPGSVLYRLTELPLNVPVFGQPQGAFVDCIQVDPITHTPLPGPIHLNAINQFGILVPGSFVIKTGTIDIDDTLKYGQIRFSQGDAGNCYKIIYTGRGSLVFASDVTNVNMGLSLLPGVILPGHISTDPTDDFYMPGALGISSNPADPSALVDAASTTKGFLGPRMTQTQRDVIPYPATGLEIYNTTTNSKNLYDGTKWIVIGNSGGLVSRNDFVASAAQTDFSLPIETPSRQLDMTGSRSFGTVYRNTSSNAVLLTISVANGSAGAAESLYCDSSPTPSKLVSRGSFLAGPSYYTSSETIIKALVLPGYYYQLVVDSGTPTIDSWLEWSKVASPTTQTDVSGSRAAETVYQNTGTAPLFVGVSGAQHFGGNITLYSDSSPTPTTVASSSGSYLTDTTSLFSPVLPGNYYKIHFTNPPVTIDAWIEWSGGPAVPSAVQTDQTSFRSVGITYQNTATSALYVSIVPSGSATFTLVSDSLPTPSTIVVNNFGQTNVQESGFAAIMPGNYYKLLGSGVIGSWIEWTDATVPGNQVTYIPGTGNLQAYRDGDLQTVGASNDYIELNNTTIRFNSGLTAGEGVSLVLFGLGSIPVGNQNDEQQYNVLFPFAGPNNFSSQQVSVDGSGNVTGDWEGQISVTGTFIAGSWNLTLTGEGPETGDSGTLTAGTFDQSINSYTGNWTWTVVPTSGTCVISQGSQLYGGPFETSPYNERLAVWQQPGLLGYTSGLSWDRNNNRLGVNNPIPAATLDVAGDIHVLADGISAAPYLIVDYYGGVTPSVSPALSFKMARGTAASPTATQSGDEISVIASQGRTSSGWASGANFIASEAAENFTPSANGSLMLFGTTPIGTSTPNTAMIIGSEGSLFLESYSLSSVDRDCFISLKAQKQWLLVSTDMSHGSNNFQIGWNNSPDPVTNPFQIEPRPANAALYVKTVTPSVLSRVGIMNSSPAYALDVNGDVNISSGSSFRVNGVAIGGISALTGDVTASGSGSVSATVAFVGTSAASDVHTAELLANAATSSNTASTIVFRDGSGNFSSGNITGEQFADTLQSIGSVGATPSFNWSLGAIASITLSTTTTINSSNFSAALAGQTFTLIMNCASHTVTWTGIKWAGGTGPTVSTGTDIYTFFYDGSNYYGFSGGQSFS